MKTTRFTEEQMITILREADEKHGQRYCGMPPHRFWSDDGLLDRLGRRSTACHGTERTTSALCTRCRHDTAERLGATCGSAGSEGVPPGLRDDDSCDMDAKIEPGGTE